MLKTLTDWIVSTTDDLPAESMRIEGAWLLHLNYQPRVDERLFQYDVALVQVQATGAAYSAVNGIHKSQLDSLVGNDARKMITDEYNPVNIALLDAMYASLVPRADEEFLIAGKGKSEQRADIICDEVHNMCCKGILPGNPKIVNIGAIGTIIQKLRKRNFVVTASDLDETIINHELGGIKVADGAKHTEELIAQADLAIITGMTISNGSLPGILELARKYNTKLMIIAETGAGFGRAYCELFGIDVVVSEPYPFYIFNCHSQIMIYRKVN